MKKHTNIKQRGFRQPSLAFSLIPVVWLLFYILTAIILQGPDAALGAGKWAMLTASAIALTVSLGIYRQPFVYVRMGLLRSLKQMLPAIYVLFFIGMVSTTWMLSGVVPAFIHYGLLSLEQHSFLFMAAIICSVTSVFTGSSWTTIATIGVALMGVGTVFGYHPGWIAGAIISGAYFGDKVSPLSDTTVLASASSGVPLLTHVRYMLFSTIPALAIALIVFAVYGMFSTSGSAETTSEILESLHNTFNITPWALLIPTITLLLLCLRLGTNKTLTCSAVMGTMGIVIFQPQLLDSIMNEWQVGTLPALARILCTGADPHTGNALLDSLTTTSGIWGMYDTIMLVCSSVIFGGTLMGTGMLQSITDTITHRLRGLRKTVTATVGTGLFLNAFTADQYLSIIIGCNIYKGIYRRQGLETRLLSRTVEDSTSVTSVLIPWNSCGMTQSTVLGVATLTYLPFCIFNIASPLMTLLLAWTGWTIKKRKHSS